MSIGQKKLPVVPPAAHAVAKSDGVVCDYPLSSVLVVFGVGLGIGVALAAMLGGPAVPPPSLAKRTELAAEKVGRQMLDAIAAVLPESLSKRMAA